MNEKQVQILRREAGKLLEQVECVKNRIAEYEQRLKESKQQLAELKAELASVEEATQ